MQITLDEMLKQVKETESRTTESPATCAMLKNVADNLADMAKDSGKITVLTDYDADGITSAYIIKKGIETLNPDCEVDVRPNDRRGSYGLNEQALQDPDFGKDFGDGLIVLDMGSNQIPLLEQAYGEGAIILDHHLITNDDAKELILNRSNYCNLHSINSDDSRNAQYCTAGLAYRVYELAGCKELADEKQNNTVLAVAAIGTAADMVDVLDEHSHNRAILKAGVEVIDNATPENFDFVIGYMLSTVNISTNTTAHELAFNAGAFLNAGGRMSSVTNENGADRTFKALIAPEDKVSTFNEIDKLQKINRDRVRLVGNIISSPEYQAQLIREKFGENRDTNIAVIVLPDNTPHAFAGLVAGKFEEAADKAVICLTRNTETGNYSGSARNPESNVTSLVEFMQTALKDTGIDVKYGGHEDALGISFLKSEDFDKFVSAIESNSHLMLRKEKEETITIPLSEFMTDDAINKVKALEPTGVGFQLPNVEISGTETYRSGLHKSGKDEWKTVRVKQDGITYDVADWSYNELAYPQSGKKGNEIELTASVALSQYRGEHIEFTAKFDRGAFLERVNELGIEPVNTETPDIADNDSPALPE